LFGLGILILEKFMNVINRQAMKDFDREKVSELLIMADSFNLFGVFLQNYDSFTDKEFWYGFAYAYTCSDNLFQYKEWIKLLLLENERRPFREYCMTPYERRVFRNLPQTLTVYRGMTVAEFESRDFGISWTLSKRTAEFFAFKYMRNGSTHEMPKMVHKINVDKKFAFAYFRGREREVLVDLT
jgi:hypothetical protein